MTNILHQFKIVLISHYRSFFSSCLCPPPPLPSSPVFKLKKKIQKQVRQVDASTMNTRLKVTVPREPALETAHRAQRHRLHFSSDNVVIFYHMSQDMQHWMISFMEHVACLISGSGTIQSQVNMKNQRPLPLKHDHWTAKLVVLIN